jgi:hypothetical protein
MREEISTTLFRRSYFAMSVLLWSNLFRDSCNLFWPLTVILSFLSMRRDSIQPLKNWSFNFYSLAFAVALFSAEMRGDTI